jgi:hypothetical protein
LRRVLGLVSVPDYTTLYPFLRRVGDRPIHKPVDASVRRQWRKGRRRVRVAVDATGSALGAVSMSFVRRMHHHGQKPLPWLKCMVLVDVVRQFVLSQMARRGP